MESLSMIFQKQRWLWNGNKAIADLTLTRIAVNQAANRQLAPQLHQIVEQTPGQGTCPGVAGCDDLMGDVDCRIQQTGLRHSAAFNRRRIRAQKILLL
jgi:hypothetical protein